MAEEEDDEQTYIPEMGNGYNPVDMPIYINPEGDIAVVNRVPSHTSIEGIGANNPIAIYMPYQPPGTPLPEEIIFEPVIETVAPPTARFDYASAAGGNVQFVNESIGDAPILMWNFGDGTTSTELNPTHTYATGGDYLVSLTVTNDGGSDTFFKEVVAASPTPEASFDFAIGGYTVYLTNRSNTTTWLWSFGDGQTSTEKHPKHVYGGSGIYTITLTTEGLVVTKKVVIDVEILLEWKDASDNEDGFKIERSPDGSSGWVEIADITDSDITSYGVTLAKDGVDSSVMNFFRIYAYSAGGNSDYSNTANVRCT